MSQEVITRREKPTDCEGQISSSSFLCVDGILKKFWMSLQIGYHLNLVVYLLKIAAKFHENLIKMQNVTSANYLIFELSNQPILLFSLSSPGFYTSLICKSQNIDKAQ